MYGRLLHSHIHIEVVVRSDREMRRNWSAEEDLVLLRQVAADRPFAAESGVMKAWQSLVETLAQCDNFSRYVDGRKLQNRIHGLVDSHRRCYAECPKLSGVSEEEDERQMLLDDIVPLLDDVKAEAAHETTKRAEERSKIDEGTSLIREKAMETMRKKRQKSEDETCEDSEKSSTGRTISHVGVYLPEPVFSHGQLYVTMSRAQAKGNIKFGRQWTVRWTAHL
ncbi:hypothetical protein AC1031_000025 [Aphanomyces cochlioides]|nr:hypothetical protein AC1031_000025 [Aphanomyces cochlioides]